MYSYSYIDECASHCLIAAQSNYGWRLCTGTSSHLSAFSPPPAHATTIQPPRTEHVKLRVRIREEHTEVKLHKGKASHLSQSNGERQRRVHSESAISRQQSIELGS